MNKDSHPPRNNNDYLIIGFSGKIGSGKDYIAKEIVGTHLKNMGIQYIHMAFSDAIKVNLMATTDISYESLYVKKTTESRNMLQKCGMKLRATDDSIWIKYLDSWLKVYVSRGFKVILISDVRFPIEVDYINERGGQIFRIIAPERTLKKMSEETDNNIGEIEKIKTHISETELDNYDFDLIINNDKETHDEIWNKIHDEIWYGINKVYFLI
jgi:hypothetical protein